MEIDLEKLAYRLMETKPEDWKRNTKRDRFTQEVVGYGSTLSYVLGDGVTFRFGSIPYSDDSAKLFQERFERLSSLDPMQHPADFDLELEIVSIPYTCPFERPDNQHRIVLLSKKLELYERKVEKKYEQKIKKAYGCHDYETYDGNFLGYQILLREGSKDGPAWRYQGKLQEHPPTPEELSPPKENFILLPLYTKLAAKLLSEAGELTEQHRLASIASSEQAINDFLNQLNREETP